jgi:protease II
MNPLKRANKGGTRIRNLNEVSSKAQELAVAPGYQRRITTTITPEGDKIHDPYDYFRQGPLSKEDDTGFMMMEQTFMNLMLMKNDYLTKQIWREQDYYQNVPHALPMLIDNYLYFRRIDNPADSLTLYR